MIRYLHHFRIDICFPGSVCFPPTYGHSNCLDESGWSAIDPEAAVRATGEKFLTTAMPFPAEQCRDAPGRIPFRPWFTGRRGPC